MTRSVVVAALTPLLALSVLSVPARAQELLIAVVVSDARGRWADPRGEFLSGQGADSVYRLLGTDGMAAQSMPPVNTPITSRIGYHLRPGKHNVTLQDWMVYMDFADKHFGTREQND